MYNINQYKLIKDSNRHPKLQIEKTITYKKDIFLSTKDVVDFMNAKFDMKKLFVEYVYLLAFNSQQKLVGIFEVSHGKTIQADIPIKEIFISLLLLGAEQFELIHNHPNGNLKASMADVIITNKIKTCANNLDILFDDHIIIADNGWVSMSYEKLM